MASRKIEDLTDTLQDLYYKFESAMDEAGLPFVVTRTLCTAREQFALYAQGRCPLVITNHLREMADLPRIAEAENGRVVTWTLKSNHLPVYPSGKARAFDIVLLNGESKANWDIKADVNENEIPDYEEAGRIGEAIGLKWGGRFSTPDRPHFEGPAMA